MVNAIRRGLVGARKNLPQALWMQSILLPPFYQYSYSYRHISQAPAISCHLEEPPTPLIDYRRSLRSPVSQLNHLNELPEEEHSEYFLSVTKLMTFTPVEMNTRNPDRILHWDATRTLPARTAEKKKKKV